ncbi:response regulator [Bacilliculturomica massiliensis]|uniref:response regulator n=1 Tax=Bacilliculturomica massiliensis TaxID=1917867 RepID=UPI0010317B7D|nr:response regulator [Bacilliculturomica massiliensis]
MERTGNKIRLLVVDDNQELCDILEDYFEIVEEVVLCGVAHNGEEALEKIAALHPDVVLLDIIMPQLDGISVLERLNSEPPEDMPRIIVASAIGQENITNRALTLGANYYMIKPYQLPELMNRVLLIAKEKSGTLSRLGKGVPVDAVKDKMPISDQISKMLIEEGMPTNIVGYQYCVRAIEILLKEKGHCPLGKFVYSVIAEENGTTVSCVESAIRKAVHHTAAGDDGKQPSNGRFLTMMTEQFRLHSMR